VRVRSLTVEYRTEQGDSLIVYPLHHREEFCEATHRSTILFTQSIVQKRSHELHMLLAGPQEMQFGFVAD